MLCGKEGCYRGPRVQFGSSKALAKRKTDKSKVPFSALQAFGLRGTSELGVATLRAPLHRRSDKWEHNVALFCVHRPQTGNYFHLTVQYCTNMPSLTQQKRCVSGTTRASSAGPKRWLCGENLLLFRWNKTKLRGLSPRANYTDRAAAAGRRS